MRTRKLKIPLLALLAALGSGLSSDAADKFYPGVIKTEAFFGQGGPLLTAITNSRTIQADVKEYHIYAEFPPADPEDGTTVPAGDPRGYVNTLEKISGFIVPPTTGDYVIFHSSDDNGGVWLSTDDTPANLKRVTAETVWSNPRQYITSGGGSSLPSKRSDQYTGTQWPGGNTIHLTQGVHYYIEAFGLEGGGGDNDSFIVVPASEAASVADGQIPATGNWIGVIAPDATVITKQPASQTIPVGSNAKFSVAIDPVPFATYTYQWTKGGVDISDGTGNGTSYQTGPLAISDSGGQYAVKIIEDVNGVTKTITSANATVTVVAGVSTPGFVTFDYYDDPPGADGGTPVSGLFANPNYPGSPNETYFISAINSRLAPGFENDSHEQYGARISGTIHVLETGDYNLFIRSDDASALYFNSTGPALPDPATATPVAEETDCCGAFVEPGVANTDGTTFPTTQAPIHLTVGTEYGFVYLYKEGGGGDFGQMAIRKVGDTTGAGQLQPIPAAYLATTSAPGGPVTITTQPANVDQPQNTRATFTVAYNTANSPVVVQWQTNGVSIPFANGTNFVIDPLPLSANGTTVRAIVWTPGGSATSANATVKVTQDLTPPTVTSVAGSDSLRSFTVQYSEAVAGADVIANYSISPAITINSITAVSPTTYRLNTAKQAEGTAYTITVSNVKDTAIPPNTIAAPNNKGTVTTFVFVSGIAVERKYDNLGGGVAVSDLTSASKYPDAPDHVIIRNNISIPDNTDNQFGATVSGYFIPPTSGDWVFFITADDHAELWLSTDEDPANLKQIAIETAWSNANKQYIGSAGGSDLTAKRSDQYANTQWPSGNTITLVANNKYYYRALMKEGGGGDNMSVLALTAADLAANDPATYPAEGTAPTGGNQIGVYVDPSTIPPVITGTTADKRHFNKGDTINLAVTTSLPGTYTYQWYHNKAAIPGATSATLQITNADFDDVGDYNVTVTNASGTSASNAGAADDNLRLIMNGAFLIEAEDFNYESGKTVAAASTMPYKGGAYQGLIGVVDVDYNNGADESGASVDAFRYGRFQSTDPNVSEIKGGPDSTDNVNSATGRDRGSWTVDANYAVGWANSGNWANYTRTFPAGKYVAIVGAAYDGTATDNKNYINQGLYLVANPTAADGSAAGNNGTTAGPMKGNQGLTKLGEFHGYQTGAWSSNDLVPLVDAGGNIVQFDLTGTQTLRWNDISGDADFILLYKVGETGGGTRATITVTKNANGTLHISWDQPGTLQKASALLNTGTVWTDVTSTSPYDATINADAAGYFRIKQ